MVNIFRAYLAQSLAASGSETTIYLDRITTINGETITTSDFSTFSRGIVSVNPDGDGESSTPEFCSFTAVDSSAISLTGVSRGLSAKSNTVVAANKFFHPVGTPVVVSFGAHNVLDLKTYIDAQIAALTIGASSVVTGTAGETITQGNLVYLKNDGKWWKTDADTIATIFNVQLGIAQGAGATDGAITGGVLLHGVDTHQSGLSAGTTYFASNTAGGISSTAGTVPRVIGIAKNTTDLYFDPDFQNRLYDYAVDSVGTDSYAVTLPGALSVPFAGMLVSFKAGTANTGACTLAINGGSAIAIKKNVSDALLTGDILQNQICTVIYDGTNFQLLSKTPVLSPIVRTYTSTDTWTKPAGLKYVIAEVQAGGGGGGGTDSAGAAASGGGGGGYSKELIAASALSATETATVGAGGTAGAGGGTETGGTGGTSSFGTTPYLSATGGSGGGETANGGSGGIGSNGDLNIQGQGGGGSKVAAPGEGGSSHLGGGGLSRANGSVGNGTAGGVYGGGGSGANSSGAGNNGGVGGAGVVIVTEYYA